MIRLTPLTSEGVLPLTLLVVLLVSPVQSSYSCLCVYADETHMFESPTVLSGTLGVLQAYDCKPAYHVVGQQPEFTAVIINGKIGYIQNGQSVQLQQCAGYPQPPDVLTTTTTTTTITTSQTDTTSTPAPTTKSTTALPITVKPITTPDTATLPTQTSTTSQATPVPTTVSSTITTTRGHIAYRCPNGWKMFGNSCYLFKTDSGDQTDWVNAKRFCNDVHSHLVFIESPDEQDFVWTNIYNGIHHHHCSEQYFWIGATNKGTADGVYVWRNSNGRSFSMDNYDNWSHGQPNQQDQCGTISCQFKDWYDRSCDGHHYGFVCEHTRYQYHGGNIGTTIQSPEHHICPDNWLRFHSSCYKFVVNEQLSWNDAKDKCSHSDGHLVFVETQMEHNFLKLHLSQLIHTSSDVTRKISVWIGATDAMHEGQWVWMDSTGHNTTAIHHPFWDVHSGQPDNHHDEDCASMYRDSNYLWNDFLCERELKYICEKEIVTSVDVIIG